MRKANQVYIYQNQEYIGKAKSQSQAANFCKLSNSVVQQILDKNRPSTKKGIVFTDHKLSEEERLLLPIRELKSEKDKLKQQPQCVRESEGFKIPVDCKDMEVFYTSRSKDERKRVFQAFLFKKLDDRWRNIPSQLANLERLFVKDVLKTL